MSKPSPVSVAFHDAFKTEFLSLLRPLGFVPAKPEHVRITYIADLAVRDLDPERRVEVLLSCAGATGDQLDLRVDFFRFVNGNRVRGEVQLDVPWRDPTLPKSRSLRFSGGEFAPSESVERLGVAIRFLAGALAANAEQLCLAVPDLANELRTVSATPTWQSAAARAQELWKHRHLRGDVEDRPVTATIVFLGQQLLTLDADGTRLTFRFATQSLDRNQPITVSGWAKTAGGARIATRLMNGATTRTFGFRGELLSVSPEGPAPG